MAHADVDRPHRGRGVEPAHQGLGAVVHMQPFAHRRAAAPHHHLGQAQLLGAHDLHHQRAQGVAALFLEVVFGPVHVGQHQVQRVQAMLLVVGPGAHPRGLAGKAVDHHRFMQRAVPEGILLEERGRRRVGAVGDRVDDTLHAVGRAGFQQVQRHAHVVVEQFGRPLDAELDAAHEGRAVDQLARLHLGEQGVCRRGVAQVHAHRQGRGRVGQAACVEQSADTAAQEAGGASDEEATAHWSLPP